MGCASSQESGRDLPAKLPPGSETFFPSPHPASRGAATAPEAGDSGVTVSRSREAPPAPTAPVGKQPPSQPSATSAGPAASPTKKKEAYVPPLPPTLDAVESPPVSPSRTKKAYVPPAPLPAAAAVASKSGTPRSEKPAVRKPRTPPSPRPRASPPATATTANADRGSADPAWRRGEASGDLSEADSGSLGHDDILPVGEVLAGGSGPLRPDILGSVGDLLGEDTDIFDIIGHEHHPDFDRGSKGGGEADEHGAIRETMSDGSPSGKGRSPDGARAATSASFDADSTGDAHLPQVPVGLHETPQPSSESGMRFDELYRLKGVLGTGAFSTVREGHHRSNVQQSYAVKCINRKKLSEEDEAALLDEVAILKDLRHAHIIRLYDFFVEPNTYYLVMERMRGGELFDRIVAKAYYNEKEARDTCKIVLEAVGHCHDNHIAHRDLKPENLLLLSEHDDTSVKIADFGFAKRVYEHNSLTTQCGTPGYVAPEILEGNPYDERADMWSVGVILYILLGGYPPFIESTQRELFRKIRKGDYEFHEEYWGTVSSEAKDLISCLLTVNVEKRLTAEEALENQWILGDAAKLAQRDLGSNLEKFRNFNAKRKFRAAVSTVMAINKLNSLKEAFFTPVKETTVEIIAKSHESEHSCRSLSSGGHTND